MKDIVWFTILLTTALNNSLLLSKINIYEKVFSYLTISRRFSYNSIGYLECKSWNA